MPQLNNCASTYGLASLTPSIKGAPVLGIAVLIGPTELLIFLKCFLARRSRLQNRRTHESVKGFRLQVFPVLCCRTRTRRRRLTLQMDSNHLQSGPPRREEGRKGGEGERGRGEWMGGWGAWLGTGALRDSNEVSKLFVCPWWVAIRSESSRRRFGKILENERY